MKLSARWRYLFLIVTVLALLAFAPPLTSPAFAQARAAAASTPADSEIRDATTLFYVALNSAIHGDFTPLSTVWSHSPDATNLNGVGGQALGWNEVRADFRNMARLFPEGRFDPPQDIVGIVVVGDIGYSVCTETGQLRSSEGPMVRFDRRATNIFEREDGKWKMIHHHADTITSLSQGTSE